MKRILLILFSCIFLNTALLRAQDYAAALKVSTHGINLEVLRSFGTDINLRAGAAFFSLDLNGGGGSEDYIYDANAKLFSASLLADYFPFGQVFRITGGVFLNLNKADLKMIPTKSYRIGGDVYSPDKMGNLNADITFNKAAPYIGIGFGNPTGGESGLGFIFDLGTVYQGPAKVNLSAEGLLSPSAAPDQEQTLEDNLNWFKWYPVLSLGLVYKF